MALLMLIPHLAHKHYIGHLLNIISSREKYIVTIIIIVFKQTALIPPFFTSSENSVALTFKCAGLPQFKQQTVFLSDKHHLSCADNALPIGRPVAVYVCPWS